MGAAEDACKKAFYDQCINGRVSNEGMVLLKAIAEPEKKVAPQPTRKEVEADVYKPKVKKKKISLEE